MGEAEAASAGQAGSDEALGAPADILVVDDDAANLLAIEVALGELGGSLVKARSGSEALKQLLSRDFAVVLLDVQMPEMDGFETAQMIRARERTKHTPIIFVTAYSRDHEDILRAYGLGAVDFLFKPILPEVLRAKVGVFVELQHRNAEVKRQEELLRALERREHERRLEEERRRWEAEAMRKQMAHLEEADRRKDEFLAMLAHELRNPLAPLMYGLELLEEHKSAVPGLGRKVEIMHRQLGHLARLVDDLLDVSRISRGKIELRKQPVDLSAVIGQAVETTRPAIEDGRHELTVQLPTEPLQLHGDAVRLAQIIGNLLSNAARYTDPGGKISICCTRELEHAVVSVRDTGRGIAPDQLERIFDMFVQERNGGEGLGLGLTLVKRLVEMHGGTVRARSEGRGRGAELEVRLPLADTPAAARAPEEKKIAARQDSLRIAIVEDNEDIRETVRMLLEAWGHVVQVAADGQAGVDLVMSMKPDVAIVDIGLVGMDGYGVARKIREAMGSWPRLIAMTGFGQAKDRQRALEAGFDAHLVKPATAETLLNALGRPPQRLAE